ncbi:MAG TPA: NUDIX hydrolase [Thermoplasmatales archaeon]|nr:NUDIX hydrolase [Thermoplasmatales archaeon]HEX16969.1 NUDIX hydrolase [Thermoplasmatales archaeon]
MPYKSPKLTVDGIVFREGKVVLIKRKREPFKGRWALPGGFVNYGERVEDAVIREVKEETGLDTEIERLFGVYSDPNRDPRGHTVSVVYILREVGGELRGGDDASSAGYFPIDDLPELAFDHSQILSDFRRSLDDMSKV